MTALVETGEVGELEAPFPAFSLHPVRTTNAEESMEINKVSRTLLIAAPQEKCDGVVIRHKSRSLLIGGAPGFCGSDLSHSGLIVGAGVSLLARPILEHALCIFPTEK